VVSVRTAAENGNARLRPVLRISDVRAIESLAKITSFRKKVLVVMGVRAIESVAKITVKYLFASSDDDEPRETLLRHWYVANMLRSKKNCNNANVKQKRAFQT